MPVGWHRGFRWDGTRNVETGLHGVAVMALEGLKRRILGSVGLLRGKKALDEEAVKEFTRSLRRSLLEADFNVRQTKDLTERDFKEGSWKMSPDPG